MSGRGGPDLDIVEEVRPCDQLTMESVVLINVDLALAGQTSVTETLPVALVDNRYPVVLREGRPLGSVAAGAVSRLVACLREQARLVADVLDVNGAYVRVRIRSE